MALNNSLKRLSKVINNLSLKCVCTTEPYFGDKFVSRSKLNMTISLNLLLGTSSFVKTVLK